MSLKIRKEISSRTGAYGRGGGVVHGPPSRIIFPVGSSVHFWSIQSGHFGKRKKKNCRRNYEKKKQEEEKEEEKKNEKC